MRRSIHSFLTVWNIEVNSRYRRKTLHEYDEHFYRFLASFAVRSAEQIVPLLNALLPIKSVVDFECGQGAWLNIWRKAGARVMGIDGPYIEQKYLMIDANEFLAADLSRPINLGRRFDVVQSLEVAEHLPSSRASEFIDTLTSHRPLVMASAAVPGQGGEHHINEQPLEYWREKFQTRRYVAIDCVRPKVIANLQAQHWYRYNILLYAKESHLATLPDRLRAFRAPRIRSCVIIGRCPTASIISLPRGAVDYLSRLKARVRARRVKSTGSLS
jgi:SAM-dependent methyltransferase